MLLFEDRLISKECLDQLIKGFQKSYLEEKNYYERLELHRNPVEVKNEVLNELYSYLIQIQNRDEMIDIDLERSAQGYVPTKIMDIWKADKRIRSLYGSIQYYCKKKEKDFNTIAIHIAEYRAIILLVRKLLRSVKGNKPFPETKEPAKSKAVKKIRVKIPKESKVRSELQKENNSTCPFCDNTDVGHFEIHHIDDNPSNNDMVNLILLCPICHSKITKGDISSEDVLKRKVELESKIEISKSNKGKVVNFNASVTRTIVGDNNVINLTHPKKVVKQKYPPGCIGFESVKANYVGHLIQRYNEYKEHELGKGNNHYGIFSSHLKKKFKIGSTRTIYNLPVEKFDELSFYIQSRIDGTLLAKRKGKAHKNYSTFTEYLKS